MPATPPAIRPATAADLPEIQAIYAHHVLHGTGTFEETPPSVEDMAARFARVTSGNADWLVTADATGILGYGYYAQFRDRSAYRHTAEDSLYIRDDQRGRGIGKALLVHLLDAAASRGYLQMLALIGDTENTGSIAVHTSTGFRHVGIMQNVGIKFDRWLDVVTMQKTIG